MSSGWGHVPFGGAQRQTKGLWAQTRIQEVPSERDKLVYLEADRALEQTIQSISRVSSTGDIKNLDAFL